MNEQQTVLERFKAKVEKTLDKIFSGVCRREDCLYIDPTRVRSKQIRGRRIVLGLDLYLDDNLYAAVRAKRSYPDEDIINIYVTYHPPVGEEE